MICPNNTEWVLYATGELPPPRRSELEAHLAGCEACRREAEVLARGLAALATLEREPALRPQVMETLRSEGAKMGVDYDASHVKLMVEQLREGGANGRVKQMKPEAAAKNLAPLMAGMTGSQMKAALGEHFLPIAKAISKAYIAAVKGERNKPAQSAQQRQDEAPKARAPLMPGRRF